MTSRDTSAHAKSPQSNELISLSRVTTSNVRQTAESSLFQITKLPATDNTCDIIVAAKNYRTEPVTISFENTSRQNARALVYILTNPHGTTISSQDPVPAVTRLTKAMTFAETHHISTSDLAGGKGFDALARFFDDEIRELSCHDMHKLISLQGLGRGIYHLTFPSQSLMTSTLLRLQEHFESPRFRGECFSLDEFRSWYRTTTEHKEFSYYSDWTGFNIPGSALKPFLDGRFGTLSPAETAVVEPFRNMRGKFYIIGTIETDSDTTLRHEIAHGLYHTEEAYRREVDKILSTIDCTPVHRFLERTGYHPAHWQDETHAYLGDPFSDLESHGVETTPFTKAHFELLRLYDRYAFGLHVKAQ